MKVCLCFERCYKRCFEFLLLFLWHIKISLQTSTYIFYKSAVRQILNLPLAMFKKKTAFWGVESTFFHLLSGEMSTLPYEMNISSVNLLLEKNHSNSAICILHGLGPFLPIKYAKCWSFFFKCHFLTRDYIFLFKPFIFFQSCAFLIWKFLKPFTY